MKKRILSILLAVMMIVPMFAMPISATEAIEPAQYSYKFWDQDIRTAGHVIDLGFKGEAAVAPVMDGVISEGEYQESHAIPYNPNSTKNDVAAEKLPEIPVHVAVKGEYLYVAFQVANEEKRVGIQYELGVMGNGYSYQAWNRINAQVKSNGTLANGSQFAGDIGLNGYGKGTNGVDAAELIKGYAYKDGVYEVTYNLAVAYRVFAGGMAHEGIWESPVISFSFWYDVSKEGPISQAHYAFPIATTTIGTGRGVTWAPMAVIIPSTSHESLKAHKAEIGPMGYDSRNMVEGQLTTLDAEIAVAPTQDGVVSDGEYTKSNVFKNTSHTGYGDFTMSYAVKDGYLYTAFEYADSMAQKAIIQYGFTGPDGATHISRTGYTIGTDSSIVKQNYMYKNAQDSANWTTAEQTFGGAAWNTYDKSIVAAGFKHEDGITTIEIKVNLAQLAGSFEIAGWDAENANAVYFMIFPDASKQATYNINATEKAQIQKYSGINYHAAYVMPTVVLPAGYTDIYNIEDVDDLEAFGQKHFYAAPSVVTLDGKISAGEYTSVESYNSLRSSDGKVDPDVACPGTNYNYFTYDDEYIYIGATVYDPNYKSGKSYLQFNLSILDKEDQKIDVGDGVKRVNFTGYVYENGTVNVPTYGGVWRCQKDADGNYPGSSEFSERCKGKNPLFAGSYDAETKILSYEFAVKISDLKEILGVENDFDNFQYLNYIVYGDGALGFNFFKLNDSTANVALNGRTAAGNTGAVTYTTSFYKNVVHLTDKSHTREGASIRISTQNAGLRFKSVYTNDYLAYMAAYAEAKGVEMEIGTLIAPEDFINDGKFTHADLGEGKYIEVMANVDTPYANANGLTTIAGSIVNIKAANLTRDFAGRGFIRIGDEIFYADTYTVRNVAEIATAALADTSANYTDSQKLILGKLNGTVTE